MVKQYTYEECIRKSNQAWELAGCARQDGDKEDEQKHIELARMWARKANGEES